MKGCYVSMKKILKGNIIYSKDKDTISINENSYIVIEDEMVSGIYKTLPSEFKDFSVTDYENKIIAPGFIDLHLHAPQFSQCGLGMDMTLMEWLDTYTFPHENRFRDTLHAEKIYEKFAENLIQNGTLNAAVFGTIHLEGTKKLMDIFMKKNIGGYIGKVNMDRNCPDFLIENTQDSLKETEEFIIKYANNKRIKPIISPRFAPTSTDELLYSLGKMAKKYNMPVQSHLDENTGEIEFVKECFPGVSSYAGVYDKFGLFGQTPTLMGHCVHLSDDEAKLLINNNVYAVHCPDSNANLTSGIMPVRKWLDMGMNIGLGTDIGAGHEVSIAQTIVRTIQLSKINSIYNKNEKALTLEEAYYLGTKSSGRFFDSKVGSLEPGYYFDALVIDDESLGDVQIPIIDRLQRFLYCGDDRNIVDRYFSGILLNS